MNSRNPLLCIPICVSTERELEVALPHTASQADLLEFRLDCLEPAEFARIVQRLPKLIEAAKRPVILTFRPAEQGGRSFTHESRFEFWSSAEIGAAAYFDIELDMVSELSIRKSSIDWNRVICSHHDFDRVPENLDKIYEEMRATPARFLKIAVRAEDAIECLPIFRLLERAQVEGRELIAIGMGEPGIPTRILGPSRGSLLTYAAAGFEHSTAPGQITVEELKTIYRIEKINRQTQLLGIIGSPVAHSFSPRIHNAAFEATNINAVFMPFEVQNLNAFVTRMMHPVTRELDWNLRGLSVTAPHKRAVMNHLDWIESAAREIGAVNTLVIDGDQLRGYNTDAQGFVSSLKQVVGPLRGLRAAVIGAGGAARAVLWSLRHEGAGAFVFARDFDKAQKLAAEFGANSHELANASFRGFDIVINTTPLGTLGKHLGETVVKAEQLRGARLVYDLVYNPSETQLLREAREAGCETLGGLSMLVSQAAAQFKLWTGIDAPEKGMLDAAENALHASTRNREANDEGVRVE